MKSLKLQIQPNSEIFEPHKKCTHKCWGLIHTLKLVNRLCYKHLWYYDQREFFARNHSYQKGWSMGLLCNSCLLNCLVISGPHKNSLLAYRISQHTHLMLPTMILLWNKTQTSSALLLLKAQVGDYKMSLLQSLCRSLHKISYRLYQHTY